MQCGRCGVENAAIGGSVAPAVSRWFPHVRVAALSTTPVWPSVVAAGPPLRRSAPPALPERRQVAVLFLDLVGFTRLTAEIGAEETQALLGAFFTAVDGDHRTLRR